jgi:hypothetical protein
MPIQNLAHNACAAAMPDNMDDHILILKPPIPAALAVDTDTGLVGVNDTGFAQPRQDDAT